MPHRDAKGDSEPALHLDAFERVDDLAASLRTTEDRQLRRAAPLIRCSAALVSRLRRTLS
jgi:hypothetical protein